MINIQDFPADLRPATILKHFNGLAEATGQASEYDTITIGVRAAKTSIKIAELLHEVNGWGRPTLTSWNMTSARQQEINTIHDTLDELNLPQLHCRAEFLVTRGNSKYPPRIINAMENLICHTVMKSLPPLWRLRAALVAWEDALLRAEERKKIDEARRERMAERVTLARQPKVYKEFRNVLFGLGGARRLDTATPIPTPRSSRPTTASSLTRDTPPTTPLPSQSCSDKTSLPAGERQTFFVNEMKITWVPFHEGHERYHTHAWVILYPPKRRENKVYVSLVTRGGEGEDKGRTTIHVRVGGGWEEFEKWLKSYLQHQLAK